LFSLAELARRDAPPGKAALVMQEVYDDWAKVLTKPDSIEDFWMGHPYRRWSTFLKDSVLDELRRSKAKVYLAQGTADLADSIIGFDVMRAALMVESRDVTAERIEGGDHGFDVKGQVGGIQKVFGNIVEWFLSADYKDVPLAELGVELVPAKKDHVTGFVVAGKNPTALIKTLREISGRSIADLEKDMRPGANSDVGSDQGFLGTDESLLGVLASDNSRVVDELGLTHQELARHLRVVAAIGLKRVADAKKANKKPTTAPFTYHGRRFTVSLQFHRGDQMSPFRDGTKTDTDLTLTNVDSGKVVGYSLLVPDMIERYRFYEGTGTPYRVAPRDIVGVLDFLKTKAK
jgi:hypothetical protein